MFSFPPLWSGKCRTIGCVSHFLPHCPIFRRKMQPALWVILGITVKWIWVFRKSERWRGKGDKQKDRSSCATAPVLDEWMFVCTATEGRNRSLSPGLGAGEWMATGGLSRRYRAVLFAGLHAPVHFTRDRDPVVVGYFIGFDGGQLVCTHVVQQGDDLACGHGLVCR